MSRNTVSVDNKEASPEELARILSTAAAMGLSTYEIAALAVVVQGRPLIDLSHDDAENLRAVMRELSADELRDML